MRLVACVFMVGVMLPACSVYAEIVLDDFDEPFEIVLPEMEGEIISQLGVGELDAERRTQIGASSGSQPVGRADANVTTPSALTFTVSRLNPHPVGGLPAVTLSLPYYFPETDITQGGINDRVVVDFNFLSSTRSLARVDVFVQDASQPGITHVSQLFDISIQDEPFSLQFPFDSFRVRGGGTGQIDFERAYWTLISVYPVYFSGPDEIGFSTAIDRVRFTRSIPEPGIGLLAYFAGSAVVLKYGHRRRPDRCYFGKPIHRCRCD